MAARLARDGPNRLDPAEQVPAWRKFLAQFADPLIYLLIAAVVNWRRFQASFFPGFISPLGSNARLISSCMRTAAGAHWRRS